MVLGQVYSRADRLFKCARDTGRGERCKSDKEIQLIKYTLSSQLPQLLSGALLVGETLGSTSNHIT